MNCPSMVLGKLGGRNSRRNMPSDKRRALAQFASYVPCAGV
jgi:hypothetical protein